MKEQSSCASTYTLAPSPEQPLHTPLGSASRPGATLSAKGGDCQVGLHFEWGTLTGDEAAASINSAYAEVVHWRRNIFKIPWGAAGKEFVRETSRLLLAFAEKSALASVAITAAMLLPTLVLQKPPNSSCAKDHAQHLLRRMKAWNAGDFEGLLKEGRVIQNHLDRHRRVPSEDQLATQFSYFMSEGKIKAAIRLLSKDGRQKVLPLHARTNPGDPSSPTVLDVLREKHPPAQPCHTNALIDAFIEDTPEIHPVIFDGITADLVRRMVLRSSGSAGPSGLDASAWQRMCTAFRGPSNDLCASMAAVARRICREEIEDRSLSAFVASRLIALDKSPGVRPIGVGEVLRRVLGKAIMAVIGLDVRKAAGVHQLCAGQEAGCEAAVHSLRAIFESADSEGVLLVDATNAFNRLNRQVALHNIQRLCPAISTVLSNTYRTPAQLFAENQVIYSEEGTTQGDPLAMAFYALATIPLSRRCKVPLTGELWFADDAAGGGRLSSLRAWWDNLERFGPDYGYFPNGAKTWLVVKDAHVQAARSIFYGTAVEITTEGQRHLGAPLGTDSYVEQFVSSKVRDWVSQMDRLAQIAKTDPQAAYSAYVHGFQGSWIYLSRCVPNIGDLFQPLEDMLRHHIIPALTGHIPNDLTRKLFALPARHGGMGLVSPTAAADAEHRASCLVTAKLCAVHLIQLGDQTALASSHRPRRAVHLQRRKDAAATAQEIFHQLPQDMQRYVALASERGSSSWLTALPLRDHGFALAKNTFRDAIRIRYGWALDGVPSTCVCGQDFTQQHALNCQTGGYPSIRHNTVRDLLASLMRGVCPDVRVEPKLQPLTGEVFDRASTITADEARLDIEARGFWECRQECTFFDVRVFNPCADSYRHVPLASLYHRQEQLKRNAYEDRVRQVEKSSFIPLVFTTSGSASTATMAVLKRLAVMLADSKDQSYSTTMGWLRCRLSFCLLRCAVTCFRGSRSRRITPVEDIPVLACSAARVNLHD